MNHALRCIVCSCAMSAVLAVMPRLAAAQPLLAELWPNNHGMKWTYDFAGWDKTASGDIVQNYGPDATLALIGTAQMPGGKAQNLVAWHTDTRDTVVAPRAVTAALPRQASPLLRNLWQVRPDLRASIVAEAQTAARKSPRHYYWVPVLLQDGFFRELPTKFEMWQETSSHPTWTYITDALEVGQKFTHQLLQELTGNVFLYGTVESNDAIVTTPAGTFARAVKITYELDYGVRAAIGSDGSEIGTVRARTRGHVYYVPHIGPVAMQENLYPYDEIDCGEATCPQEWQDWLGKASRHLTLQLTSGPLAIEALPWGTVKNLYR